MPTPSLSKIIQDTAAQAARREVAAMESRSQVPAPITVDASALAAALNEVRHLVSRVEALERRLAEVEAKVSP